MEPKFFKAKITARKEVAKDTVGMQFEINDFEFRAGQYIWLILEKLLYQDTKGERRAFSICSSPNQKGIIAIFFRKSESGFKKTLLELPLNSEVNIYGPFGSMTFPETIGKPMIMIAGGTGIAPFLSMIKFATENQIKQKMTLIYANHDKESAAYLNDLSYLRDKNLNFSFISVFGKLTWDIIKENVPDPQAALWYVIGPAPMVEEIGNLLFKNDVAEANLIFEEFYVSPSATTIELPSLLNSINLLKGALEKTPIHIVITDVNGTIVFANKGAENTTRFTKDELIGQTPRIWGGLMSGKFYQNLWNTIKFKREPFVSEIKNRRKTGDIYYAIAHITPLFDQNNILLGFMASETDISGLKGLQRRLANEKARDDAILASIGDGLIITDETLKINIVNSQAEKLLGFTADELIGKSAINMITVKDAKDNIIPVDERMLFDALRSHKIINSSDYYFVRKNNTKFPVAITAAPIIFNENVVGTVDIFRDITREKEIDKAKTEFLSIASHQLRSPLGAMRWNLELILGGDIGEMSTPVKESLNELYKSTLRLIGIINDLLVVSRIEQGRVKNESVQTDILKIINEAVAEIKPGGLKNSVSIEVSVAQNIPEILVDPKRFREVIENLLSNAVRYSRAGQKVLVTVNILDGILNISVSDSGIGIPQKDQYRIFSKFFRAANAMTLDPNGSGLGLFVVKSYVEGWGGKVSFESLENVGTTFTITVPMKAS